MKVGNWNVPNSWRKMTLINRAGYLIGTHQAKNFGHAMRIVEQEEKEYILKEEDTKRKILNYRSPYAEN